MGVGLEGSLIGFNGNCNGLFHEGSFHLSNLVLCYISVAGNFTNTLGLDVIAFTIHSSVRILSFQFKGVFFNVFESLVHETTIAALVSE